MKKQILMLMLGMILLISISSISAEISYWQTKENIGNGTIKNHLVLFYSKGGFGISDDYVSGNNPYEVYLLYNVYVNKWNTENPNYKISDCNLVIKFWGHLENTTAVVFNQTWTGTDPDVLNVKYFMRLSDGDGLLADEICDYTNSTYTGLELPAEMQIVTPSWECKACQYYEWSLVEGDVAKAQTIGDNVVSVSGYIKKFFMLNFEIWLALFWLFLIIMIFISISFIFVGVYWLFLYLKNVTK